jgi:peptidoglycan glycosyltransferase
VNGAILRLFGLVMLLFAVLVAFTSRWTVFEAEALRDNPKNKREILEQQRIPRGVIRAADGTALARSRGIGGGEERIYTRVYPPEAEAFSHALGYSFVRVGRAGIEQEHNDTLTGETNEVETLFDELTGKEPVGNDLVTSLDLDVQRAALQALAGRQGGIVALDPRTGAVKAMVSNPGYSPGEVNDPGRFSELNRDDEAPLFNRATQSGYAPGSTFKVVTAVAAIDSGEYTPQSTVTGKNNVEISGVPLQNFGGADYGVVDLTLALTKSVNTAWATIGEELGKETMGETMERLGFNREPPLDYPETQLRASGEYRNGRLLPPTSPFVDVGRMAIGQDKLQVTPLQMAMVASAVANGGKLMQPQFASRSVDRDGRTVERFEPELYSEAMKPETAEQVGLMMESVVREGSGTAAALSGIDVAGKTGTADVGSCPQGNQLSFIGFAPAKDPRAAVAVTIECAAGTAGVVAAPVAKQVMEAMLR